MINAGICWFLFPLNSSTTDLDKTKERHEDVILRFFILVAHQTMSENCLASMFIHGHHQTILFIQFDILGFNAADFFFITLCTSKEMSSIFMRVIKVKAYYSVPLMC